MNAILEIGQAEFEQAALKAEGLVVVDFGAKWCGPCRRMEPELEAAAQEIGSQVKVLKVDVDASPEISMKYGVQGIPNLTFIKGGQVVDVAVGSMPKASIVAMMRRNL
jgi:thioredoxin